jgi:hypothetical protein
MIDFLIGEAVVAVFVATVCMGAWLGKNFWHD